MDHDELAAQYREAREAITAHRVTQAREEVALGKLLAANRGRPDTAEITDARARVDKAVADVEWCRAVTVAAGEAFKGMRFDDVPNDLAAGTAVRDDVMRALDADRVAAIDQAEDS